MPKISAGLLMFRSMPTQPEVFLVHPGGPFWAKKDLAAWTIPKGEPLLQEELLAAAIREFTEETGFPSTPPYLPLGEVRQPGGKIVHAWAFAGDCDPATLVSNTCSIEWPPRSRRQITFPEVDRGGWFTLEEGRSRILQGQQILLDRLTAILDPST